MVILEIILIIYIYGLPNFLDDLRSMFGYPRTWLGRIFGPTGYYIQWIWCFLAPLQITEVISASKFQICSYSYSYFVPPLFLASYSYSYLVPPLF
uniref:Uncharacterized protein n=1 Tax=Meloidogyne incognita TaxID=6306 RepID=A0A914MV17_MELIC